jgi:hypothetical protein
MSETTFGMTSTGSGVPQLIDKASDAAGAGQWTGAHVSGVPSNLLSKAQVREVEPDGRWFGMQWDVHVVPARYSSLASVAVLHDVTVCSESTSAGHVTT